MTRCATVARALPQRSRNAPATSVQRGGSGARARAGSGILAGVAARERVIELRAKGMTAPQIAEATGANLRTVQRILADAGEASERGRPSTGTQERVQIRVDAETMEVLDEHAERDGTSRDRVAAKVLTAWAKRSRAAARTLR